MNRGVLALALATELATFVATHPASAQRTAPADVARAEAHDRFDRGLALFDKGDNAGALVEFQRAYQLVENVVVLFNIGLVFARMGRAVEATEALDNVLGQPGTLSPERLALARRVRDEQALRIAAVAIAANITGARIEVDGIDAGTTPLVRPLRILSGTHVISAEAAGFLPERKAIAIAGGDVQEVRFNLVAAQGRLAHLVVNTHLPGASLLLDNQLIGTTPLNASISVAPGTHSVELQRNGYWRASTSVTLGEGATAEVILEPDEDPTTPGSSAGVLSLALSESSATFTVDGRPRGVYRAPLRLPTGPHRVQVARDEFMPFEADVDVPSGQTTTLHVTLVPSPGYVTRYSSRTTRQRSWAIISIVGGALTLAGGVALLVYDADQRDQWSKTASSLDAAIQLHSGKSCDPSTQDSSTAEYRQRCVEPVNAANGHVNDANTRDYLGWSAFGLGLAAAALSVVLFVTGDDPHKYDDTRAASQPGFPCVFPTVGAAGRSRGLMTAWSF
jgi:PEGA domain